MELKEVAAVSGRGGLFKILKPTKSGVILEAIDASKKRFVAGARNCSYSGGGGTVPSSIRRSGCHSTLRDSRFRAGAGVEAHPVG